MRLVPFTQDDFDGWLVGERESYAQARASSGIEPLEEALVTAAKQLAELLPDGLQTPDHELFTLWDGDEQVGLIWLAVRHRSDGTSWYVYNIEIREDLRRRGYGRSAMDAVEALARERGIGALELNVFGDNHGARALYEQIGFVPTAIQMRKVL